MGDRNILCEGVLNLGEVSIPSAGTIQGIIKQPHTYFNSNAEGITNIHYYLKLQVVLK